MYGLGWFYIRGYLLLLIRDIESWQRLTRGPSQCQSYHRRYPTKYEKKKDKVLENKHIKDNYE
jgi:hypothetical protein